MPPDPFDGPGVYTIYYDGTFAPYAGLGERPIYVGKADGRLHSRLTDHAGSIDAARNLALPDFGCRWLVIEPVWIGLTEQILIGRYDPVWNRVLKGFGNHHQGGGRRGQARSLWDTMHPGRHWAETMAEGRFTVDDLIQRIADHRTGEKP